MQSEKIQASHKARIAYVYVRQSSPYQVEHNLESQRLQYQLVEKARQWGFTDVRVIDEDLGLSGAESDKRNGFQKLVAEVTLRLVGIIMAREVSRLARNNADWYHLLDLCALFDTLIADQDGIYHPGHPNDRMILGLKGTMSEVELTVMKSRLLEGARNKAKRGELIYRLPVGMVCIDGQRIDKDPDARVRAAVDQVFSKFREMQSVRQVMLWFLQEELSFPKIEYASGEPQLLWKSPTYTLLNSVLKNPFYAGAYVYGRRTTRTEIRELKVRKTHGHPLPMAEWKVVIKDHHPGYITWEEYEKNQRLMAENFKKHGGQIGRGPTLGGSALLVGCLRCRRCGRKLSVHYGGKSGKIPVYMCSGKRVQKGGSYCLSFGGLRLDEAVSQELLKVVRPVAIDAAFQALEGINRETEEQVRLLSLEREQAEYEADRAFRRYCRVEPENRLVAVKLETAWNEALQRVEEVKGRITQVQAGIPPLSQQEKESLLLLAEDLPRVWYAESTTAEMHKRILRTVLEEVLVDVDPQRGQILVDLHWIGGTHTRLEVKKNRVGRHRYSTDYEVVDLVRQLATQLSDKAMVPILNKLGYRTGHENPWTASRICSLRNSYGIPSFDPEAPRPFLTLQQTAEKLGICMQSARELIRQGIIAAHQIVTHAPWCVKTEEVEKEEVRKAAAAIVQRRPWRWRVSSRKNQPGLFQENQGF
jgi:DNA invertase Pin-like site-specific DNA recombinase